MEKKIIVNYEGFCRILDESSVGAITIRVDHYFPDSNLYIIYTAEDADRDEIMKIILEVKRRKLKLTYSYKGNLIPANGEGVGVWSNNDVENIATGKINKFLAIA